MHSLSLAVFAFAVEDMKARDCVITSASPLAFLYVFADVNLHLEDYKLTNILLISIHLTQLH
jgi:hypothetical protein